jgi:hypothetical protein
MKAAVKVLAGAFAPYAWTRHVLAEDDYQRRVTDLVDLFVTRIGKEHGSVWVGEDADAQVTAAAV